MSDFKFHRHPIEGGRGTVHVLVSGPDAQEVSMLAAMYSRTTDGVEEMVDKVSKQGAGKFMEKFYIGYGHQSIGDLVDVRLFIEGIPLYVAPFLEHHSLFRGQETSSRFVSLGKQPLYGPRQPYMHNQMQYFSDLREEVMDRLTVACKPEDTVAKRAVAARSFDVTRGFIPMGVTTNVAWFGSIREMKRHLSWLVCEYAFLQPWAYGIYDALREVYPESLERDLEEVRPGDPWTLSAVEAMSLPYRFYGSMDFGSLRDLNRHRVGWQRQLLLPMINSPIFPWYPDTVELITGVNPCRTEKWDSLRPLKDPGTFLLGQTCEYDYRMPDKQARYFAWRRNQMDVHPTLRLAVQDWALGSGLTDVPFTPDVGVGYVLKRGEQTIVERAKLEA